MNTGHRVWETSVGLLLCVGLGAQEAGCHETGQEGRRAGICCCYGYRGPPPASRFRGVALR